MELGYKYFINQPIFKKIIILNINFKLICIIITVHIDITYAL